MFPNPSQSFRYSEQQQQQSLIMDGYYAQASHTCNYCSKVLPTYGELVEHKKTHVGERPFSCHICHKRFTQKAHLNIHKRTHTGEKPYPCNICHKRFAQSSHLNSHRRIHAGDRPYFCIVCNTGFSQKHRFDAHLPCMQQTRSRSSARISAAFSSAVTTASMAAAYGGGAGSVGSGGGGGGGGGGSEGGSGSGIDIDMDIDQKPDVRYLEALNQQALMQQLAEFSSVPDSSQESVQRSLNEGELSRNSLSASIDANLPSLSKDEQKSNISAACLPAMSSHRRKPTMIRHVDSEENMGNNTGNNNLGCKRDTITDGFSGENNSFSIESNGVGFGADDDDEKLATFQNGVTSFHDRNGLGNVNTSGPVSANQSLLATRISPAGGGSAGDSIPATDSSGLLGSHGPRSNHRISLVNFTAEELLHHLTTRSDIHRCDYCRLIFQDAAMYHIHRNMHDKNDLRCCNLCGKMNQDRYDFIAHFLNEHR